MNTAARIALGLVALVLVLASLGCASPDPNYQAYLAALNAEQVAQASRPQQQLIHIKAQPGQQITGLESITVYAPPAAGQGPQIAPPTPQPSPWAQVLDTGLRIVGQVAGYKYGADVALGLAGTIRDAGTAGYQYVQAPGSVTTLTNSGNTTTSTDASVTTNTTTTSTSTSTQSTANSHNPVTTGK